MHYYVLGYHNKALYLALEWKKKVNVGIEALFNLKGFEDAKTKQG